MTRCQKLAFCPRYQRATEIIGRRWTGAIVRALIAGRSRFGEIAHTVPQISDRLLSMRLRELESEEIVVRDVAPALPVAVRYGLTPKGRELEPAVSALRDWARNWLQPD